MQKLLCVFWQADPLERLADTEMRRTRNADRGTCCPAPQRGCPEGTDPGPLFGRLTQGRDVTNRTPDAREEI
jgi:hypothetical protein